MHMLRTRAVRDRLPPRALNFWRLSQELQHAAFTDPRPEDMQLACDATQELSLHRAGSAPSDDDAHAIVSDADVAHFRRLLEDGSEEDAFSVAAQPPVPHFVALLARAGLLRTADALGSGGAAARATATPSLPRSTQLAAMARAAQLLHPSSRDKPARVLAPPAPPPGDAPALASAMAPSIASSPQATRVLDLARPASLTSLLPVDEAALLLQPSAFAAATARHGAPVVQLASGETLYPLPMTFARAFFEAQGPSPDQCRGFLLLCNCWLYGLAHVLDLTPTLRAEVEALCAPLLSHGTQHLMVLTGGAGNAALWHSTAQRIDTRVHTPRRQWQEFQLRGHDAPRLAVGTTIDRFGLWSNGLFLGFHPRRHRYAHALCVSPALHCHRSRTQSYSVAAHHTLVLPIRIPPPTSDAAPSTHAHHGAASSAVLLMFEEIYTFRPCDLARIDQLLRQERQVDAPFGGLHVCFGGDVLQLAPVHSIGLSMPEDVYIAQHSDERYRNAMARHTRDLTVAGLRLFHSIDCTVMLHSAKRFRPPFDALISRLAHGQITVDDIALLQSRVIRSSPAASEGSTLRAAVHTNRERMDVIEASETTLLSALPRHALPPADWRQTGVLLLEYTLASPTRQGRPLFDAAALRALTQRVHDGRLDMWHRGEPLTQMPLQLVLVVGECYRVTMNQQVSLGTRSQLVARARHCAPSTAPGLSQVCATAWKPSFKTRSLSTERTPCGTLRAACSW